MPDPEMHQGYEIVLRPEPRTGSASAVTALATPRHGGRPFEVRVAVTDSAAGQLRVSGDERARELAAQLARGMIDTGEIPESGTRQLEVSTYWEPWANDDQFSDSNLKDILLRAAFRMHRLQALESRILEIDADGVALALGVQPERVRGVVADLLVLGLIEGYAESFGRTAVDGRFRITGEGIQHLEALDEVTTDATPPTRQGTWPDLEVRLAGLGRELQEADTLDDFQDVGRRCREIAIDAANAVFTDSMVPAGEMVPRRADPKTRINYFLAHCASGGGNDELRRFVRATWELAQATTHSENANLVMATASAEATLLLVRTLEAIHRTCSWHVDLTFTWHGDEGGNTRYKASWTSAGGFGDIRLAAAEPGDMAESMPPVEDSIIVVFAAGRTLRFEAAEPLSLVLVELVEADGSRTRPSSTGSGAGQSFAEFRQSDVPS